MSSRRVSTFAIGAAVSLAIAAGCSKNATPPPPVLKSAPPPTMPAAAPAPPSVQAAMFIASDLPLLPPGVVNAVRPVAVTKAVYEFAARHPEVLNHIPCFCGCERGGHKGNHDCFVAGRDPASGAVKTWDSHGITCEICIDVGEQAMQMHGSGASVADIRAAVDRRYASAMSRTPTPHPTRGGHDH